MIYQRSNGNLVERNIAYGNALQGINLNDSAESTIRDNSSYDNGEAGIGVGQSAADNLLAGNTVRDNRKDGISLYSDATRNTVRENVVSGNARSGISVKSAGNVIGDGNRIFRNAVGISVSVTPPPQISLQTNQIYDNREDDVRGGAPQG